MYLKKAIRGTMIIFLLTLLSSASSYLLRILLARNLSVAEYGLFYAIFAFFSFLALFIDLGLNQAVAKHVVDANVHKQYAKSKTLLVSALYIQFFLSATLFAFFALTRGWFSQVMFHTDNTVLFVLMGVWFLTLPIPNFFINLFIGFKRPELSSLTDVFRQVCSLVLTALFIFSSIGLKSPFIAYACINALMLIMYFPLIKRVFPEFFVFKAAPDMKTSSALLKYGLYVALSTLVNYIITQTDTLMLSFFRGTEAVGLYQAALPLAMVITYFSSALVIVAYPFISEIHTKKEVAMLEKGSALLYKYALMLSLPIAFVVFSFAPTMINLFFGEKYLSASGALMLLVVMNIFSLMTYINNNVLVATGHPKEAAKNMSFAAVVNVASNLLLIPAYGIIGASIASLASFFVAFILSSMAVRRHLRIMFPIRSSLLMIISAAACVGVIIASKGALAVNQWAELFIIGFLACLVYLLLLFLFRVISVPEIREMIAITLRK